MRRLLLGALTTTCFVVIASTSPGCGSDESSSEFPGGNKDPGTNGRECAGLVCPPDGGGKIDCVGFECQQTTCENGGTTSVSGTVFDPAGKVPIYNATVYVPNADLTPFADGANTCDRCDAQVSGKPIAITATDTSGKFKLENVPVGENVPLVIQIGKWRRKVTLPSVARCTDTPLDAGSTRLPRNRTEGDIPRIALTTGGADPLQCLLRKIGLDDSEFGTSGSDARVHLYAGGGFVQNGTKAASSKFDASVNGGAAFGSAETLWSDKAALKNYDVVLMSCEGDENETAPGAKKPDSAKQALYDYASEGGRVFASHYHEVWFRKSPVGAVKAVASWADPEKTPPAVPSDPAKTAVDSTISSGFPKAVAMHDWLKNQSALGANDALPIVDARHNVDAVGTTALDWISLVNKNAGNGTAVQYMSFNTPVGAADDAVCGRVVFSNLHVGAGSEGGASDDPQADFPNGCKTTELSAQQRALEFMLFDLSSCIQKDDAPIVPPR
ncbi:Tryptophan synthase alpha chain [Labilithrix luteola]|uniref:Tryptophan synthase alpha chain n=1 Tax=Labilithrix luteola TaxID=1391654 RepID=A0A0K1PSL4_9BACT|nr:carboxypeptidase-like regulatory domain-containing protein [Labilithrix luteola]AKU96530.1 Tryptophan synthase alpha chain [Labilithrix luteola]